MLSSRSSGILLHLTSLPSPYGIGDLGPEAYRFADFLARAKQRFWQVLPLGPVGPGASPYSSPSTFAGNPLLISPTRLKRQELITRKDLVEAPELPNDRVDFERVAPFKHRLLARAFERFEEGSSSIDPADFTRFRRRNAHWLRDYALFMTLKEQHSEACWTDWDAPLARRDEAALDQARRRHAPTVRKHAFWQFLFAEQWSTLKDYCNERDLYLFGDIPIYVAHDSADVWAHQELFRLDRHGEPRVVAGVPPDYFSETGQRWGNPIYRWGRMKKKDYAWWIDRLKAVLSRVDLVRLDHFRGFEAYWEIPASEETAVNGEWVEGPGASLFEALGENLSDLPVVAEDLGVITPEVRALMRQFDIPGMAVFAFGLSDGPDSDFLPHHYRRNLVAYTTTHDTDTFNGWLESASDGKDPELDARSATFARRYLDLKPDDPPHWTSIRSVMGSVAQTAIFPLQDLLGLGSEARMNTPGEPGGNWRWRFRKEQLTDHVAETLTALTEIYDRDT